MKEAHFPASLFLQIKPVQANYLIKTLVSSTPNCYYEKEFSVRSGTNWALQTMLTASDGVAGDGFGYSVSISGLYAVVGAINDEVGSNTYQGSVYVFRLQGGILWTQQAKLTASDGAEGDELGHAVSIGENHFLIGAPLKTFSIFNDHGAAYIFRKN